MDRVVSVSSQAPKEEYSQCWEVYRDALLLDQQAAAAGGGGECLPPPAAHHQQQTTHRWSSTTMTSYTDQEDDVTSPVHLPVGAPPPHVVALSNNQQDSSSRVLPPFSLNSPVKREAWGGSQNRPPPAMLQHHHSTPGPGPPLSEVAVELKDASPAMACSPPSDGYLMTKNPASFQKPKQPPLQLQQHHVRGKRESVCVLSKLNICTTWIVDASACLTQV